MAFGFGALDVDHILQYSILIPRRPFDSIDVILTSIVIRRSRLVVVCVALRMALKNGVSDGNVQLSLLLGITQRAALIKATSLLLKDIVKIRSSLVS